MFGKKLIGPWEKICKFRFKIHKIINNDGIVIGIVEKNKTHRKISSFREEFSLSYISFSEKSEDSYIKKNKGKGMIAYPDFYRDIQ